METIAVDEGEEILELVRRGEKIDVALIDVWLSEMDDLSLVTEIRRLRGPKQLALVLLTTLGWRDVERRAPDAAVLSKPVKQGSLYRILTWTVEPSRRRPPRSLRRLSWISNHRTRCRGFSSLRITR